MVEIWGKVAIFLGVLMMGGELAFPGMFMGAAGVAFIVAGTLLELGVSDPVLVALAFVLSGLFSGALFYLWARNLAKRGVHAGGESLVNQTAQVTTDFKNGQGTVKMKGEEWSARQAPGPIAIGANAAPGGKSPGAAAPSRPLKKGDTVRVKSFEGVFLTVEYLPEKCQ